MSKDFYEAVKKRRTIYGIGKESPISDERIKEIVELLVKETPSSFNSQSSRVVVLFGKNHDKLWEITKETLRKIVPEGNFSSTEEKINSFKSGYGTILYFEDQNVIKGLQDQFQLYKDNFPVWSEQSSGMLQINIWNALSLEGLGASLQHYNPLIDDAVRDEWHIPQNWKLIGQMPFGKPTADPGDKDFIPIESRVKFF
ncbi:nitroreductase [Clostridium acetobutylicum]|nr:nitroreductase [Clostridium acetobutylicum]